MKVYYVYKITNLINNKIYIGKHTSKVGIDNGYFGSGIAIKHAITKYGKVSFKKDILEICPTQKIASSQEKVWIRKEQSLYPNGYNLSTGGDGGCNFIHSPNRKESIKKISLAAKGKKWTDEMRARQSKNRIGKSQKSCGRISCLNCRVDVDIRNFFKWHNEKCKDKPIKRVRCEFCNKISESIVKHRLICKSNPSFKPKPEKEKKPLVRSEEHKRKIAEASRSRWRTSTDIFECNYCHIKTRLKLNITRFHNEKCKNR